MYQTLQLNFNLASHDQLARVWAFAKRSGAGFIIHSCSKQAKALGIKPGMPADEAKTRLPALKIMFLGKQETGLKTQTGHRSKPQSPQQQSWRLEHR